MGLGNFPTASGTSSARTYEDVPSPGWRCRFFPNNLLDSKFISTQGEVILTEVIADFPLGSLSTVAGKRGFTCSRPLALKPDFDPLLAL